MATLSYPVTLLLVFGGLAPRHILIGAGGHDCVQRSDAHKYTTMSTKKTNRLVHLGVVTSKCVDLNLYTEKYTRVTWFKPSLKTCFNPGPHLPLQLILKDLLVFPGTHLHMLGIEH